MRDHFEAKELGVVGEISVPRNEPAPPAPPPLVIPAPPWSQHYDPTLDPDYEPASEAEREEDEQ
jgi:hypothetical protein